MPYSKSFLAILFFISISTFATDEKNAVAATLKSVTVYKTGAELSHTASASLKQGNNELTIDRVANTLDINSIQIKTDPAVTIMGVEFGNNYLIKPEKTKRQLMLEDSLETVQTEISKLQSAKRNNSDLLDVLKVNRDIKGTQTGLSVAELMKFMDYFKTKTQELQSDNMALDVKTKKLSDTQRNIYAQVEEERKKNSNSAGRLILQLNVAMTGKYEFTISYIANSAYWTPFYDVKVDNTKSPLKLVTKAKISQTTGIDWKQVKLSLSTSIPSQWGNAPVLSSWYLGYINPVTMLNKKLNQKSIQSLERPLSGKVAEAELSDISDVVEAPATIRARGNGSISSQNEPLVIVNGTPISKSEFSKINQQSIKSVNVLKDAEATTIYGSRASNGVILVTLKDGLEDYVSVADNTLNLSYDIDLPYDVPTNGKPQTAIINSIQVNANYKHYAVPKSDKDAYLLAEITNWEKLNLLPGEANVIVEGTYIGKSFINPSSTNDTLNLTLGRDKRVVVKRSKITDFSSVKFLGSNKLQKFTYEITVRNTKNEAIDLLLKDQFPLTTLKEIEVELIDDGGAEVNNDLGVLNWKLNLAAGESKKIRFSYSIKYPKDKTINLN